MTAEILDIVGREAQLRVLLSLRTAGPQRFGELEGRLKLNPAQLDRALKALRKGFWIVAKTLPAEGERVFVEYALARRGEALLGAFDAFRSALETRRAAIGAADVRAVELLYA